MVKCSKAQVGTCCQEDRTGHPAWKYSKSNLTIGSSCADARMSYCKQAGTYGTKYCPSPSAAQVYRYDKPGSLPKPKQRGQAIQASPFGGIDSLTDSPDLGLVQDYHPSIRPTSRQCGKMTSQGFTCCCGGEKGCGPAGFVYTKDRNTCCSKWDKGGGLCFSDAETRPQRGLPPITPATLPLPKDRKAVLKSRFDNQNAINDAVQVHQFPGGERPVTPKVAPPVGQLKSRFGDRTDVATPTTVYQFPDDSSTSDTPSTPASTTPDAPAQKNPIDQFCKYFKWVPVGEDCNTQVIVGTAAVVLGGVMLVSLLRRR